MTRGSYNYDYIKDIFITEMKEFLRDILFPY